MTRKILIVLIIISSMVTATTGYKKLNSRPITTPIDITTDTPPVIETPKPKTNTFEDALSSITQDNLKTHTFFFAGPECEGRMSGKQGNIKAAAYIKEKLSSYGLQTMYDKFPISRHNSGPKNEQGDNFTQNIYGWIEGTDPVLKDEIVVIGAHMDHIGYGPTGSRVPNKKEVHPGADDNASGTAAVLSLAESLSKIKDQIKRTVVFQLYSGEELGLFGSEYYVKNPKFPISKPSISNHIVMINLDMIGHLGKGQYSTNSMIQPSIDLKKIVSELSTKYSFADRICNFGSRESGSDHIPFYNKGVPVVFLHTGLHAYYHTPEDTVDTLDFSGMEQISRFALDLVWKITQSNDKIKFNYSSFVELPSTHDHGVIEVPFQIGDKN